MGRPRYGTGILRNPELSCLLVFCLLYSVSCLLYSVFFIDLYSEKVNLVHHFREHDGP